MSNRFDNVLPEKDYALWLGIGLVLLIVSQIFSKQPGTLALILRWVLLAAATINYGIILYLYDRDRRARKKEQESADQSKKQNAK